MPRRENSFAGTPQWDRQRRRRVEPRRQHADDRRHVVLEIDGGAEHISTATVAASLVGATVVLYDGSPGHPDLMHLIGCIVRVDGEVTMTAAGAAVMGHPAASVAWLANQLAAEGETLKAGQLIFSGGVTTPVPVVPGGSVTFEFDGLGAIEVYGA